MSNSMESGYNLHLCYNIATAFLDAGKHCNELDRQAQNATILFEQDAFYAIPAIVNTAFACELFLKGLLIDAKCSSIPRKHSLIELYKKLPGEVRNELDALYDEKQPPMSIMQTISIHTKAFENWRYAFEYSKGDIEAYPDNLELLAEVLYKYIHKRGQS